MGDVLQLCPVSERNHRGMSKVSVIGLHSVCSPFQRALTQVDFATQSLWQAIKFISRHSFQDGRYDLSCGSATELVGEYHISDVQYGMLCLLYLLDTLLLIPPTVI